MAEWACAGAAFHITWLQCYLSYALNPAFPFQILKTSDFKSKDKKRQSLASKKSLEHVPGNTAVQLRVWEAVTASSIYPVWVLFYFWDDGITYWAVVGLISKAACYSLVQTEEWWQHGRICTLGPIRYSYCYKNITETLCLSHRKKSAWFCGGLNVVTPKAEELTI